MTKKEKRTIVTAAVLAAPGAALMTLRGLGMRFSGILLLGIAALLLVGLLLRRWEQRSKAGKWCRRMFSVSCGLVISLLVSLETNVLMNRGGMPAIPADAVIVLGAGVNGTEPSLSLRTRLDAALDYLEENPDVPVVAMVTRLVRQKGLDLVTCVMEDILKMNLQFVILGSGDSEYSDFFEYYASAYPGKIAAYIGFDAALASQVYAGADLFLMPSMFEPCGLSQLISMAYGTIPVVRETGGLCDTVTAYNEYTGEGNGFSFANFNAHEMLHTLEYAISQYDNKEAWDGIVSQAMKTKFDWPTQSKRYIALYKEICC